MFQPKLEINNKILDLIVEIELDFYFLKMVNMSSEWDVKLKAETLVKRVVACLRDSGILVSHDVVSKVVAEDPNRDENLMELAKSVGVTIRENELQMILNVVNASKFSDQLGYIVSKFNQESLTMKELTQINRFLGERMVMSDRLGKYRQIDGTEVLAGHPFFNEIPYQLDEFLRWLSYDSKGKYNGVLVFSVILGELLRILPFDNFNFETCILFSLTHLKSLGYTVDFLCFEEEFQKKKEIVEEKIKRNEFTGLAEIILEALQVAVAKAKSKINNTESLSVKFRTGSGKAVALSERQLLIMEELTAKEQLTIREIRDILPQVSDDTILRDLKDLISKKMIRKKGKTRGAVYFLGKTKMTF